MKPSDLRTPVISALRWTALSRLLMQLITWSATIFAVRLLSPADYGIVTIATLLSNYLALLGEAGFGSAIVQKQVRDRATLSAVFTVLFIAGTLLAGVIYFSAPLIGEFFHEARAVTVMRLAALQFMLLPFSTIPDALLRMDLRFKELGIANIAGAVTSAISVVILALFDAGPYALIVALLLNQTIRTFLMQWYAKTPVTLTTGFAKLKGLLRYSTLIVIERSAWFWYTEIDNAIVARALGTNTLGVFSVAKNIVQAPLDRIAEVLNAVSFPAYSRIQQHGGALSDAFLKSLRVGSYVVFPLFWGLGAVAEPLVELAFGEKWRAAILPMQILSVAMPLRTLQSMSTPLIHAIGRPDISLKYTACAVLVIIPLLIIGVVNFGVAGAAGAWAIGYPILYALSVWLFTKPLAIGAGTVWLVLLRPMIFAALMTTLVCVVIYGFLDHEHPWLRLVIGITIGAIFYVGGIALCDRKAFRELSELIRSFARH